MFASIRPVSHLELSGKERHLQFNLYISSSNLNCLVTLTTKTHKTQLSGTEKKCKNTTTTRKVWPVENGTFCFGHLVVGWKMAAK